MARVLSSTAMHMAACTQSPSPMRDIPIATQMAVAAAELAEAMACSPTSYLRTRILSDGVNTYKHCFSGEDVLRWLKKSGLAGTTRDAVTLAQAMIDHGEILGLFTTAQAFKGGHVLYKFCSELEARRCVEVADPHGDDDEYQSADESEYESDGDAHSDDGQGEGADDSPLYTDDSEADEDDTDQELIMHNDFGAGAPRDALVGTGNSPLLRPGAANHISKPDEKLSPRAAEARARQLAQEVIVAPCEAPVKPILRKRGSVIVTKEEPQNKISLRRRKRKLKFDFKQNRLFQTYAAEEYERSSWYDMDTAMDEWEEEEDDERVRQLFVRWACMEFDMPEGYECPERVVFNRETVRLGHLTRQAQEHARKTREDVTDRLLACLTAADKLYNDLLCGLLVPVEEKEAVETDVTVPGKENEDDQDEAETDNEEAETENGDSEHSSVRASSVVTPEPCADMAGESLQGDTPTVEMTPREELAVVTAAPDQEDNSVDSNVDANVLYTDCVGHSLTAVRPEADAKVDADAASDAGSEDGQGSGKTLRRGRWRLTLPKFSYRDRRSPSADKTDGEEASSGKRRLWRRKTSNKSSPINSCVASTVVTPTGSPAASPMGSPLPSRSASRPSTPQSQSTSTLADEGPILPSPHVMRGSPLASDAGSNAGVSPGGSRPTSRESNGKTKREGSDDYPSSPIPEEVEDEDTKVESSLLAPSSSTDRRRASVSAAAAIIATAAAASPASGSEALTSNPDHQGPVKTDGVARNASASAEDAGASLIVASPSPDGSPTASPARSPGPTGSPVPPPDSSTLDSSRSSCSASPSGRSKGGTIRDLIHRFESSDEDGKGASPRRRGSLKRSIKNIFGRKTDSYDLPQVADSLPTRERREAADYVASEPHARRNTPSTSSMRDARRKFEATMAAAEAPAETDAEEDAGGKLGKKWRRSLRGLGSSLRGKPSSTTAQAAISVGAGLPASAPASEAGDLEFAAGVGSSNEAWLDQSTSSRSTARVQPSPLAQRSANTHLQASFDTDDTGSISEPPQLQSREAKRLASPLILPLARLRTDMPELLRREGVDLTAKERHLSAEDFQKAMACSRVEFYALPLWRQQQKKKLARIF